MKWWRDFPDANIGIRTGSASNLVVIDADSLHAFEEVKAKFRTLAWSTFPTARTGRGYQWWFGYMGGTPLPSRVGILPQVDVRADNGYTIAPRSIHISGTPYRWIIPCPSDSLPVLPRELFELIRGTKNTEPTHEGWVEELLHGVPEGERANATARLAGHLISKGIPEAEIALLLKSWNPQQ